MRFAGNLVDNLGLPRTSFWVVLMIVDKDDIIEAFVDDKVLVNIDVTDTTDMVGEESNTFFVDAK
jgi:hypothetical protein